MLVKQRLMNAVVPVHITLLDKQGQVYNTLEEGLTVLPVRGSEILQQPGFSALVSSSESYLWNVHEPDYLLSSALPGTQLFSLFAKLQDTGGGTFAYLRISLDMKAMAELHHQRITGEADILPAGWERAAYSDGAQ